MKIQPIEADYEEPVRVPVLARTETAKPVFISRLRRLFVSDRQLHGPVKDPGGGAACAALDPNSVCLAKMVQNYIEESNEKPNRTRHGCNCFLANGSDSSDDELDNSVGGIEPTSSNNVSFSNAACDVLKILIPCASVVERNLLADTAAIVERSKNHKQKDHLRKIVVDGLTCLGYNAYICRSKWDKSPSYPAGEHEYIDVIQGGTRHLIDIDFRSEFEMARSTSAYKIIVQSLPNIFIGKSDRLGQIVSIVSEAARQSLKKKGMHLPPWRKAEYMRAKWLSPSPRETDAVSNNINAPLAVIPYAEKMIVNWGNPIGWQLPVIKPTWIGIGLASLLRENPL